MAPKRFFWLAIAVVTALAMTLSTACSSDATGASGASKCNDNQLYDQVNDTCAPRGGLSASDTGDATLDAASDVPTTPADTGVDTADVESSDVQTADVETDAVDPACDKDHDGALAESCGGYDCDDNDPSRSPYNPEFCDNIDNNCSGTVNDNVTCAFYAHSGNDLYEIDPFAKTATKLSGSFVALDGSSIELLDIDTHPDGTLFGISRDGLYHFDTWSNRWIRQGDFGIDVGDPNGLAIDSTGTAFVTSQDKVYTVDVHTGHATLIGSTGSFYSSGDCVVNKRDTLFMTSKSQDSTEDTLVQVSRQDGHGTAIGKIGFKNVFGLTAAWGTLYGLTLNGELISINQQTGEATLVHKFNGISFFGAASTPNR